MRKNTLKQVLAMSLLILIAISPFLEANPVNATSLTKEK